MYNQVQIIESDNYFDLFAGTKCNFFKKKFISKETNYHSIKYSEIKITSIKYSSQLVIMNNNFDSKIIKQNIDFKLKNTSYYIGLFRLGICKFI